MPNSIPKVLDALLPICLLKGKPKSSFLVAAFALADALVIVLPFAVISSVAFLIRSLHVRPLKRLPPL